MLNPPAIGGIVSFGINLEKASRYERRKRRPVTRLFEREKEQRAESAARFPFDRTSGGPKKEKEYRISAEMGRIVTSDREDFSRMRNKNGTWNYSESMHRIVLRLIRPRERRGISICNCAKRVKKGRTKQAKQKAWTRGNWKFWDREPSEMTHRNDDPSLHPFFVFDSAIPRSLSIPDRHNVRPLFMLTNAPFRFVVRLSATPPHSLFIFISLPTFSRPPLFQFFSVHDSRRCWKIRGPRVSSRSIIEYVRIFIRSFEIVPR